MTKKFDDIEKKEPFQAPDGYFDKLEERIMDRIEEQDESKIIRIQPWLKYAVAASVLLLAVFFILRPTDGAQSAEDILADVPADAIVEYLSYSEISTDEILESTSFSLADVDSLHVIDPMDLELDELDLLIEEYSLINLDSNSL